MIDTIAEYAPKSEEHHLCTARCVTPLDLEREFGLTEGNIFQGELSLEQLFFLASGAGLGALPHADQEPLHVRIGDASGRRNHGRAGKTIGARGTERWSLKFLSLRLPRRNSVTSVVKSFSMVAS